MDRKNITWDLSDLGKLENIDKEVSEIRKLADKIEKYRKNFNENISSKEFLKILNETEKLMVRLSKNASLIHLNFYKDTKNPKFHSLTSKIDTLGAEISNKLMFISLEFKKFSEKNAERLIKETPSHSYYLKRLRELKDYTLAEEVEKVINLKDVSGINALISIYYIFVSEFKYEFEGKKITQEELLKHVKDPNPKRRERAYESLLGKYRENKNIISLIYSNVVNNWMTEIQLRGYKSPISIRNEANDLEDEDVDTLLRVFEKNIDIFREYFNAKAKALGVKKLRRYDIYSPMSKIKKEFDFNKGRNLVIDSFSGFDDFKKIAEDILKNHVDSEVKEGKRGGAFCHCPNPKTKPFVMMSYTGDLKSVETLAHELGHGIHFSLSSKNNIYSHDAVLPMAETASTFCETLWLSHMKKKFRDIRRDLIFTELDGAYASIARQFNFVIFEKKAHELIKNGGSSEDIEELYLDLLKRHFGDSIELNDIFRYEYLYIPHIFETPFYCYAYGFGLLLALSLYRKYLDDNSFKKDIVKIFKSGSNDSPRNILKKSGIEMNGEFWQNGFDYLRSLVKDLK